MEMEMKGQVCLLFAFVNHRQEMRKWNWKWGIDWKHHSLCWWFATREAFPESRTNAASAEIAEKSSVSGSCMPVIHRLPVERMLWKKVSLKSLEPIDFSTLSLEMHVYGV